MRRAIAWAAGITLAVAAVIGSDMAVPHVSADCGMGPPPQYAAGYGGIAFIGTVKATEPGPDHTTVLVMDVERPILGADTPTLTIVTGIKGNCSYFWGDQLGVGDRFLLAYRPVQGMRIELPEGATYADTALVYRPTADGWRFARRLTLHPGLFPERAQQADTLAEILDFLDVGSLPTDAEPSTLASPVLSARGETEDDLFRLIIETPGTTFTAGEPITPITTFAYIGKARTLRIIRYGDQTLGFDIRQLDGPFAVKIVRRTDCGAEASASPEIHTVTFTRGDNRDAASRWNPCLDEALAGLGPGTYTIETIAEYDPVGRGRGRSLRASVTIAVVDATPAGSPATGTSPVLGPPEAVLDAYLAALLAGDCETARLFTTSTFTIGSGELCGGATVLEVEVHPAGPARPSDDEVVFATTLAITGGDASMPDGEQPWFYVLGRQPDGSWRLTGGGSGP